MYTRRIPIYPIRVSIIHRFEINFGISIGEKNDDKKAETVRKVIRLKLIQLLYSRQSAKHFSLSRPMEILIRSRLFFSRFTFILCPGIVPHVSTQLTKANEKEINSIN